MADYFPLILRAVSALDPNTPERREAIYARAREALDRQLTSLDPPIPEADLRRERGALEATIRRVETQFAAPPPPFRAGATNDVEPPKVAAEPAPPEAPAEPPRPKLEIAHSRGFFADRRRAALFAMGLPVVVLIAGAAYVMKDDPARYLPQASAPNAEVASATASGRKTDSRLDGSGVSASPATGPRPAPPPMAQPALPVASRVLFFEESPADPRGVQSDGIIIWRLEAAPAQPGRPADQMIRGSMTIVGAKMAAEITIKRNRDAALPASHTIELVFRPEAGAEGIRDISPIEARDQEANPGVALQGALVPVAVNLFLIGLDRSEIGLTRNLDALREKRWFAFQFRYASGRLGAMLIEKGPTGDRVFREALDSWQ